MMQVKRLYKGDHAFNRIILLSIGLYVHIGIVYLYINALYS